MRFDRNKSELDLLRGNARVIGLTGGIGSGKSVATDALKKLGYNVIDADEISRETFAHGDGEKLLAKEFPFAVKGGAVDRKKLRDAIAADEALRDRLNALTHPLIISEIKRRLDAAKKPVVLSAPLLLESELCRLCDVTVCVYCKKSVRAARIAARDNISEEQALRIIDAQIPDTERCSLADLIVPSERDQAEFIDEITELFAALTTKKQ